MLLEKGLSKVSKDNIDEQIEKPKRITIPSHFLQ